MASKIFLCDIDLNGNQIKNVVVEKLDHAPDSPIKGQIYFDIIDNEFKYYNGTSWISAIRMIEESIENLHLGTASRVNIGFSEGEIPVLGVNGKLSENVIPSLALVDTRVVNTHSEMLGLEDVQRGDICIVNEEMKTYILSQSPASVESNWIQILSPLSDVTKQYVDNQDALAVATLRGVGLEEAYNTLAKIQDIVKANKLAQDGIIGSVTNLESIIGDSSTGLIKQVNDVDQSVSSIQIYLNDLQYSQFMQDSISKYDKYNRKIIECLLPAGTDIQFPDYSFFNGNYLFPVEELAATIFRYITFRGNFKMNNLKKVSDCDFEGCQFDGTFEGKNLQRIGDSAFLNSIFTGSLNIPLCEYIGEQAFRHSGFNGTLTAPLCKYIGGEAFRNSTFTGSFIMPLLEYIGSGALQNSQFAGQLNLPNCTYIADRSLENSNFSGILNLPKCEYIGHYSLYWSTFSGRLNIPECKGIGSGAFMNSTFSGILNLPKCEYIRGTAFRNSQFTGSVNLPNCTAIEWNAFENSQFTGELYIPACTTIKDYAFLNSNFSRVTIGANASLSQGCIGAHSGEFTSDYTANNMKAGTYVWDSGTSHWIYQS